MRLLLAVLGRWCSLVMAWFEEYERGNQKALVEVYGEGWADKHGIVRVANGTYACSKCWRRGNKLADLGRVIQHIGTKKHQNTV